MHRETQRAGTERRTPRTLALALGLSLLLGGLALLDNAEQARAHVPDTLYVNVVRVENIGCSDDEPDLQVTVYHENATIGETGEATNERRPVFGQLFRVDDPTYPARFDVRVEEGESALFRSPWYEECDLQDGPGRRGAITYDPDDYSQLENGHSHTWTYDLRGDEADAVRAEVTVGPDPPARPAAWAESVETSSAYVMWDDDPAAKARAHTVRWGDNGGFLHRADGYGAGGHQLTELLDNTEYTVRVLREAGGWNVASKDVTFTTENAPPQTPQLFATWVEGGEMSAEWRSPTTHDIDRFEFHAAAQEDFVPTADTLRGSVEPFASFEDQSTHGIQLRDTDAYVLVRAVDTGGLHADSAVRTIGWDYRSGSDRGDPWPPEEPRDPPPEPEEPRDPPPPPPPDVRITRAVADDGRGQARWELHGPDHHLAHLEVHLAPRPDFTPTSQTLVQTTGPWERWAEFPVPEGDQWVRVRAVTDQGRTSDSPSARLERPPSPPPEATLEHAVVVDGELEVQWTLLHRGGGSASAEVHVGPRPHFVPTSSTLRTTVDASRGHARTPVDGSDAYVMLVVTDDRGQRFQTEPVWIERHGPPEVQVGLSLHTGNQLVVEWRGQTPDGAEVTLHAGPTPATASAGAEARAATTRLVGLNGWVRMEAPAQHDDRYVVLKVHWEGGQYVTDPVTLDLAAGVDVEPDPEPAPEPYEEGEPLERTEVDGKARVQSEDGGVTVDTLVKVFGGGAGLGGIAAGVGAALRRD